jgi:hypothetical protein
MALKALTPRQLNRSTLARQMLLQREDVSVVEGIRRAVALQAQEAASPYVALWNRIAGFDPADLDAAFIRRDVVKATLMRATLHAVHSDDYTTFRGAMAKRLRDRLNDSRFRETGLEPADFDALIPLVLEHTSGPRSVEEIEGMLEEHLGAEPHKGIWWAVRNVGPLQYAPTDSPWTFGQRNLFIAPTAESHELDAADSLVPFIRRYLEGFGPASAKDFGQFTLQTQAAIKPAIGEMADDLVTYEGPNGEVLHDVPNGEIPEGDTAAPPRLMAMWDSVLLAYSDRSRIIPEEYRKTLIRNNGDVLPTVLVDGFVAGIWRPTESGIEVTTFRDVSDDDWDGIEVEAQRLGAMIAMRDPRTYGRYSRWWNVISGVQTRVFAPNP